MTSDTARYAAACTALAVLGVGAVWPLLDEPGRTGLVAAATLALPLQIGAFAALRWGWNGRNRFLAAWVGGTLARMAALAAAVLLVSLSALPPAPTLLALASFFFAMLLIEPLFLRRAHASAGGRA